ncbi:lipid A biosynthesis lauroyl acyltransferase [Helicobacter sp. faydin-H20]|uniref:lipid A biosynthesis lauroyl acyltransferase n=1 Tax=Helicobacter anatolicus TaxID=2905874 RepID=UPI001E352A88|nr:lipid A biosynthesis lauroyl acyltransferase [Helicobacter anatolicus]MCE3037341.1 lipid A biosynthesis lauroyl acyltransferase [Helicobacter anatolicus]
MKIIYFFLNGWIVFLGFIFAKMPHFLFYFFVCFFAFLMRLVDKRRFYDAMANLDFVYGDHYSKEEKIAIIRQCYKNFVFVLLESMRLPYISQKKYFDRFEFENENNLLDFLQEKKSVVLVSAHYGYWESLGSAMPLRVQKVVQNYEEYSFFSLGRLTDFDFINQLIIKRREIFGVKLIDKKGAFKKLIKIYSSKDMIVGTGILVDQNISKTEGVEVQFFGKRATHTTIASLLSRRFDIFIVPILIDFNKDYSKYIVRVLEPFKAMHTQDMQKDILECTQRQADVIEKMIKKNPSSWFWFHKRWKSFYPEIYQKKSLDKK